MKESYLGAVLRFTFRGFVLRTDALQIILASAAPALFHLLGATMPEGLTNAILAYIAYVVLGFLALRFVTAPYFIWREQNKKINELETELAKPEKIMREYMAASIAEERLDMINNLLRHEDAQFISKNDERWTLDKVLTNPRLNYLSIKLAYDAGFSAAWTDWLDEIKRYSVAEDKATAEKVVRYKLQALITTLQLRST